MQTRYFFVGLILFFSINSFYLNRTLAQVPFSKPFMPGGASSWGVTISGDEVACFDDDIYAVLPVTNARTIIGGAFKAAGLCTGGGARVSTATGSLLRPYDPATMRPNGAIYKVIADAVGGWYITGGFNKVGALTRDGLAHINPDGTVDVTFSSATSFSTITVNSLFLDGTSLWIGTDQTKSVYVLSALTGADLGLPVKVSGTVSAITKSGTNIVLGGAFRQINADLFSTGVILNSATGSLMSSATFDGAIYSSVSDGAGGWYVAGAFTEVNGVARNTIARINSDGTLNSWYPTGGAVGPGAIWTMLRDATTGVLYVGGEFSTFAGISRNNIAAVDAAGVVTSWDPNLNSSVWSMAFDPTGNTIYVGGYFGMIGADTRTLLGAIDKSTGLATPWAPVGGDVDGPVYAIEVVPTTGNVIVGGDFWNIGGVSQRALAELTSTGVLTSWYPTGGAFDGGIYSMSRNTSTGTLYIGGSFTTFGGSSRAGLGALTSAAVVSSWNPNPDLNDSKIFADSSTGEVYVGGNFSVIQGLEQLMLAKYSAAGSITSWYPPGGLGGNSANVKTISKSTSGQIFVGGAFGSVGGTSRKYIGALNATTGVVSSWYPSSGANYSVTGLGSNSSGDVYIGGYFDTIGGLTRYGIARATSAGTISSWYPSSGADGPVYEFYSYPAGNVVYVRGNFSTIGGTSRASYAALNETTAAVTSWNPSPNLSTLGLILDSGANTLYAIGNFTSIGGQAVEGIAKITAAGTATSWAVPGVTYNNIWASALSTSGELYIAGQMNTVGGVRRSSLAAVDSNGSLTTWYPAGGTSNLVLALAQSPLRDVVYVGGNFTTIGGSARNSIAAVNSAGQVTSWMSGTGVTYGGSEGFVYGIYPDATNNRVYLGGHFDTLKGSARSSVGAVTTSSVLLSWGSGLTFDGDVIQFAKNPATGRIYVSGGFQNVNATPLHGVAAVTSAGVFESAWVPVIETMWTQVNTIAVASSGELYIGGSFSDVNYTSRPYLAGLDNSGNLTSWTSLGGAADNQVTAMALTASGDILVVGQFDFIGGVTRMGIAKLDPSGNILSWYPTNGVWNSSDVGSTIYPKTIAVDGLGKVHIGGRFSAIGDALRSNYGVVNAAGAPLP